MEKELNMVFMDAKDNKTTVKVKDIKDEITQEDIVTLMDAVIASKVIPGKTGELTKKNSATITETNKTSYVDLD